MLPAPKDPLIGQAVGGSYVISQQLDEGGTGAAASHVNVKEINWQGLRDLVMNDPAFLADAAVAPKKLRPSTPTEIEQLLSVQRGPISKAVKTASDSRVAEAGLKMQHLMALFEKHYGLNGEYTGAGVTKRPQGQHPAPMYGAREMKVEPNGTGYQLTPENSHRVTVGKITRADVEAYLGNKP